MAEGLFNEEEFHRIEIDIEGYNPEHVLNFGIAEARLLSMEEKMDANRNNKLKDRLKQIEKEDFSENAKSKIRSLLDVGDLLLANEYSEYCKNNKGYLPESEDLLRLPIESFEQILAHDDKQEISVRKVMSAIESGRKIGPFDYSPVRRGQRLGEPKGAVILNHQREPCSFL